MKKIIILIVLFSFSQLLALDGERISPEGVAFIDPEVYNPGGLLTYQTGNGQIWIGELNPVTGLFISANGFDFKLDSNAAPPIETFNGPEFGYNKNDWSIVYSKNQNGIYQIWEAKIQNGVAESRQVTFGNVSRQTALATKNPNSSSTRIIYTIGGFQGVMAWKDLNDIDTEVIIDSVDRGIRWINHTNKLAYIKQTGEHKGEIAIYDTDTQSEEIISNDGRTKTDPYGWLAPEYGNQLLVAALLDGDTKIGIYKKDEFSAWEIIREIEAPANSEYGFFGSPEPFTAAGKSYFSCVIKEEERAYSNSEVWIFSLADGINTNHRRRIEDGVGTAIRSDPETFIGDNEVFIYYNIINSAGKFEAFRARTGLETLNDENLITHIITPKITNNDIDGNQEPHYTILNKSKNSLNKLMLYFPGTNARPYDYLKFSRTAANLGYHAISLSYENLNSVNYIACGQTTDTTCHRRARTEIWFGEDTHDKLNVDFNNSIIFRLTNLLQYLALTYPDEGWLQYIQGDEIQWNKITVAGHSQGGGHAGFASKLFKVERCIMIAASDWVQGQTADWIRKPGPTDARDYYGFIHLQDFPASSVIMPTWRDYGILNFGMPANVDISEPPYGNVHALTTGLPVPDSVRPHNYLIVDFNTPNGDDYISYLYSPAWEYLLNPDINLSVTERESAFAIYPNPASEYIEISFDRWTPSARWSPSEIKIYNTFGELVLSDVPHIEDVAQLKRIDISHLPVGLYFIQIGNYTEKFMVVR